MDIRITPSKLRGVIAAIPSKSDLHRALICASLSDRPCTILLPSPSVLSKDMEATIRCLTAMGAVIRPEYKENKRQEAEHAPGQETGKLTGLIRIEPIRSVPEHPVLRCGESGSTLRFLLPVAAYLCKEVSFEGEGRLPERPLSPLPEELEKHGIQFSSDRLPFAVSRTGNDSEKYGKEVSVYTLPGNISSQYITGLLLAAPLMGGIRIRLTTPLESAAYVAMTIDTMRRFGVCTEENEDGYLIAPQTAYTMPEEDTKDGSRIAPQASYTAPEVYTADGDWSNAAFFLAAGSLKEENRITVSGLSPDSIQGDKAIGSLIGKFSERRKNPTEEPLVIEADGIPDLVPILSVLAALTPGETRITKAERLRLKESDRIASVAAMIRALGGDAEEMPDGLILHGKESLPGGTVQSCNDHRIAMAAAAASTGCTGKVTILGAEATEKSYPGFWEDFSSLGGQFRRV